MPRVSYTFSALEMIGNTSPFNITHHPAMTAMRMIEGFPAADAGRQALRRADDHRAYAFEQAGD
jgi:amidase